MIEIGSLDVYYGNIRALREVSLHVGAGEIVAIIGANGAGKSTLIKTLAGLIRGTARKMQLDGITVATMASADIARLGLAVVPEARRLFGPMSVLDNLRLGAYSRMRFGRAAGVQSDLERVMDLFPRLRERSRQEARTLSGGEQQMLAIGRAMMARPRVILMDEPSIGLAPLIVRDIFAVIRRLKAEGTTIVLVEQNAMMALKVADRAYVLELGSITLEGPATELKSLDRVKELYLGG